MGSDDLFKKRKLERRRKKRIIAPDRFLIVCEGEKTEPNYFKSFKEMINQKKKHSVDIEIKGEGANTISLVKAAIQLKEQANPDYSQVWCVFDKDSFTNEQFNEACQMAEQNDIFLAYSNESFELWYVLHFEYSQSALTRYQYVEKLKSYLGDYKKNQKNIYELLNEHGNQKMAFSYAEKLCENVKCESYARKNPSTTVHRLVAELQRFI
ncbi:RloB family protein [Jeotgalibacillus aurantiacus]|uniref:RloB family protein n=1 Tax=Jeotgalibacillus aurantiacus TaxID=2763266 RepID=UPI001D0B9994|nr:RloB family protein [Jeotgalibacillus aurantiacus]